MHCGAHHGLREVLHKLGQGGALQHLEHCVLHFLLIIHVIALVPTELVLCHHLRFKRKTNKPTILFETYHEVRTSLISKINQQPGEMVRNMREACSPDLHLHVEMRFLALLPFLCLHPLLLLQSLHQLLRDVHVRDWLQHFTYTHVQSLYLTRTVFHS